MRLFRLLTLDTTEVVKFECVDKRAALADVILGHAKSFTETAMEEVLREGSFRTRAGRLEELPEETAARLATFMPPPGSFREVKFANKHT